MKQCSVEGCDRKYRCSGFCKKHYAASRYEKDRLTRLKYDAANKEKLRQRHLEWAARNPEKLRANAAKWRREHPEERKRRNDQWRAQNAERHRENARKWSKKNIVRVLARNVGRRAAKLNATPAWANLDAIREMYRHARALTLTTGVKWHVDHIVPLNSDVVCGLHCEANLQIVPYVVNLRKSNREWPDMPTPQEKEIPSEHRGICTLSERDSGAMQVSRN